MIEMIGFTSVGESYWISVRACKVAAAIGHVREALGHLDRPEQSWTGCSVDAAVGESSVDMYSRVPDSRCIGEENRWQNGITAAHSGHASKAKARLQVMAAIRM